MASSQFEARQLRAFVALAEQGTLTGAARTLGVAQSTLSEAIAALERAAGVVLVLRGRGTNRSMLTRAGHALLPHARAVLAAIHSAQLALAETTNSTPAPVNIIANESIATYFLPRLLGRLRGRWPNTQFAVSVATCPEVRCGVRQGEFDIGLLLETDKGRYRHKTPTHQSLPWSVETIASAVPLVLLGVPTHPVVPRTSRSPVARDELAPFSLLVSDAAGDFHDFVERLFRAGGKGPRLQATGSIEAVKRGVLADSSALGLLPAYAVADDVRAGRMVHVDVRPALPRMRLDALLSRSRSRHPGTIQLIDELRRTLRTSIP
jgi:DNA-binding transcriptional LysR family regulator